VRREDPHSQLRLLPGLREDPLPLTSLLSVLGYTCVREFPTVPLCSASLLAHMHLLQHLCQGFAIITVSCAPTLTVFPKLLASDVHVNLFHSHTVLQIKLRNVSFQPFKEFLQESHCRAGDFTAVSGSPVA